MKRINYFQTGNVPLPARTRSLPVLGAATDGIGAAVDLSSQKNALDVDRELQGYPETQALYAEGAAEAEDDYDLLDEIAKLPNDGANFALRAARTMVDVANLEDKLTDVEKTKREAAKMMVAQAEQTAAIRAPHDHINPGADTLSTLTFNWQGKTNLHAKGAGLTKDMISLASCVYDIAKNVTGDDAVCRSVWKWIDDSLVKGKHRTAEEDEQYPKRPPPEAGQQALNRWAAGLMDYKTRLQYRVKENENDLEAMYLATLMASVDGQIASIGLTHWARAGYPHITMGHKLAAALLCTNTGDDALEFVREPWRAFVIEVPNGLLYVEHAERGPQEIRKILVTKTVHEKKGETWAYVAYTESELSMWRFGVHTKELLPAKLDIEEQMDEEAEGAGEVPKSIWEVSLDDVDRRTASLIGRLIIGTCLAMSDRNHVRKIGRGHDAYAKSERDKRSPEPMTRTFVMGHPVTIDLRQHVRGFASGARKGGAPSVQVLVRGHWRLQAHGPKHSLRKPLFIEPFWRGAEDAPILVRPHALKKED